MHAPPLVQESNGLTFERHLIPQDGACLVLGRHACQGKGLSATSSYLPLSMPRRIDSRPNLATICKAVLRPSGPDLAELECDSEQLNPVSAICALAKKCAHFHLPALIQNVFRFGFLAHFQVHVV